MTNGDGIIRIERRGRRKVQIGDGQPIGIDVIDFVNRWSEMEEQFRDEKRQIDPNRRREYEETARQFIREVGFTEDLTAWEVLAFLKQMTKEADRLVAFFDDGTPEKPSSPKPTEVVFSQ